MSLTRQQKEERVAKMEKTLSEATSVVFMAYDALPVGDSEELRDNLFAERGTIQVIPKRLLRLALQNVKLEFNPVDEEGQVAVISGDDAVVPAKVAHAFAKDRDAVRLVAGVMEGELLSAEQVHALAKLPSKQELLGQFVSVLVGPMRGFQTVLTGAQRQTVQVLSAIAEQKNTA